MNNIYLCKPNGDILGNLTGLKQDTCSLKKNLTELWELTFEVDRYIEKDTEYVQSDYYESLTEGMDILLNGEDVSAHFIIDSFPEKNNDGMQEILTVTAHSCECELQNKFLKLFYVNCGTPESLEYLADNNLDEYRQLPIEYISLVNYENPQLSLLHLALNGTQWTVADDLEEELCKKKFSFSIDNQDRYSFLVNDVANTARIIFDFDRKNRIVSFKSVENIGEDTGVFIGLKNLMNELQVKSSSEDNIITKCVPHGANKLGIEYVNFGRDYILNYDYFMNALTEYGDYRYVTKELHDKYVMWCNYRDKDVYKTIEGTDYTRRTYYSYLTKKYNDKLIVANELRNRLPNDGCNIDYTTYKAGELLVSHRAYTNALFALVVLYKEEYGVDNIGDKESGYAPIPSDATNIHDTPYWYDFYSFKEKIIPSVEESLKIYCKTDSNGNLEIDKNGEFIVIETGNPDYNADTSIVKSVDAWIYEFSLYGLDELNAKKKAWCECSTLLYKDGFVKIGTKEEPIEYITPDETGWNSLTDEQKSSFTNYSAFVSTLNDFLDYMSLTERDNKLTGTVCKGVIRQCEDAILERMSEIESIETEMQAIFTERNELANSVTMENCNVDDTLLFNEADLKLINLVTNEQEYSNENILITSLDDIVKTVDVEEELYKDCLNHMSIISQPQYYFTASIDNIYGIDEFASLKEHFDIGNFIRVNIDMYKDIFVKLRLVAIEYNPLVISEDINVEFSSMTKSLIGISDFSFLLGENTSGASSNSNSSGGSGGAFGKNDAEIRIANNMLNALLKTETFGTSITDVMIKSITANVGNFNRIAARSGIFDLFETGEIKVNGNCLVDTIKSKNWNGEEGAPLSNTQGSIIMLDDGSFSFGGGKLKYSPTDGLVISGYANEDDLGNLSDSITDLSKEISGLALGSTTINGGCIKTGNIISNNYNGTALDPLSNTQGSIIMLDDGSFSFGGGRVKYNGSKISIEGDIYTKKGSIGGFKLNDKYLYSYNNDTGLICGMAAPLTDSKYAFWAGGTSLAWEMETEPSGGIEVIVGAVPVITEDDISKSNFVVAMDGSVQINSGQLSLPKTGYYEHSGRYLEKYFTIKDAGMFISTGEKYYDSFLIDEPPTAGDEGILTPAISAYEDRTIDVRIILSDEEFYQFGGKPTDSSVKYMCQNCPKIEFYGSPNKYNENKVYNKISAFGISGFNSSSVGQWYDTLYAWELGNTLRVTGVYDSTISSGSQVYIDSDGYFHRYASSSKRYKNNITTEISKQLNPHKLYDINVSQFRYNDDYLENEDQRYNTDIIGFIAEDLYEKYPIACNLDSDGRPEVPEYNMLIAPMLKLIQEQHAEIENLKERILLLEQN